MRGLTVGSLCLDAAWDLRCHRSPWQGHSLPGFGETRLALLGRTPLGGLVGGVPVRKLG